MNNIEEVKTFLIDLIRNTRILNGDNPDYEILLGEHFEIAGKTPLNLDQMSVENLILFYGEHQNRIGFDEGLCK